MTAWGVPSVWPRWWSGIVLCGMSTARMPTRRAPQMSSKSRSPTKTQRDGSMAPTAAIAATGDAIHQALTQLHNLEADAVRRQRREKFLAMGRNLA
jgi:hypothetical protein